MSAAVPSTPRAHRATARPPRWPAVLRVLALGLGAGAGVPSARAAPDCAGNRGRVETLICADPALTRLDDELRRLFDRIVGETRGVDGETGQAIDLARWLSWRRPCTICA